VVKRKQLEVPGTEREIIEEISMAAVQYREKRDARSALSKEEAMARKMLLDVMQKNNRTIYDDVEENVRVKIVIGADKAEVAEILSEKEED